MNIIEVFISLLPLAFGLGLLLVIFSFLPGGPVPFIPEFAKKRSVNHD